MAKIANTQQKETRQQTSAAFQTAPAGRRPLSEKENQEVQKLAYQFFLERDCQHGHDQEDWLRAETVVRARRAAR